MIDEKKISHREIYLKNYGIKVSLSLITFQKHNIRRCCIKNFIVNPLSPLEADLLVNRFKQKIVWYYLGENKVFFYPKNVEQLCFPNIRDAENAIINKLMECIHIDILRKNFIEIVKDFFIKNKWLIYIGKESIEARKSSIIESRFLIVEIKIFHVRFSRHILEVLIKIYPTTYNESVQLLRKTKAYWGKYFVSSKIFPYLILKFLFKGLKDWEIIEKTKNLYDFICGEISKL